MRQIIAVTLALSVSAGASAQELATGTLSDDDLLALRAAIAGELARSAPVALFGVPSGFGLSFGQVSAGAALTDRRERRYENDWDASLSFALGLGDPETGVGATLTVDITSVSPFHFGQSGTAGLTLHRRIGGAGDWQGSLALSADNLIRWGDSDTLSAEYTLTGSWHRPGGPEGPPVLLTIGYGSAVNDAGTTPGLFGGVGVGLSDRSAASLAWAGDEAILGLTLWPDWPSGVVVTLGMGDVTGRIDGRRAILAVSWSADLRR